MASESFGLCDETYFYLKQSAWLDPQIHSTTQFASSDNNAADGTTFNSTFPGHFAIPSLHNPCWHSWQPALLQQPQQQLLHQQSHHQHTLMDDDGMSSGSAGLVGAQMLGTAGPLGTVLAASLGGGGFETQHQHHHHQPSSMTATTTATVRAATNDEIDNESPHCDSNGIAKRERHHATSISTEAYFNSPKHEPDTPSSMRLLNPLGGDTSASSLLASPPSSLSSDGLRRLDDVPELRSSSSSSFGSTAFTEPPIRELIPFTVRPRRWSYADPAATDTFATLWGRDMSFTKDGAIEIAAEIRACPTSMPTPASRLTDFLAQNNRHQLPHHQAVLQHQPQSCFEGCFYAEPQLPLRPHVEAIYECGDRKRVWDSSEDDATTHSVESRKRLKSSDSPPSLKTDDGTSNNEQTQGSSLQQGSFIFKSSPRSPSSSTNWHLLDGFSTQFEPQTDVTPHFLPPTREQPRTPTSTEAFQPSSPPIVTAQLSPCHHTSTSMAADEAVSTGSTLDTSPFCQQASSTLPSAHLKSEYDQPSASIGTILPQEPSATQSSPYGAESPATMTSYGNAPPAERIPSFMRYNGLGLTTERSAAPEKQPPYNQTTAAAAASYGYSPTAGATTLSSFCTAKTADPPFYFPTDSSAPDGATAPSSVSPTITGFSSQPALGTPGLESLSLEHRRLLRNIPRKSREAFSPSDLAAFRTCHPHYSRNCFILMQNGFDIRLGEVGRAALKKEISRRLKADAQLRERCVTVVCRLKNANVLQLLQMAEIAGCLTLGLKISSCYWKEYSKKQQRPTATSNRKVESRHNGTRTVDRQQHTLMRHNNGSGGDNNRQTSSRCQTMTTTTTTATSAAAITTQEDVHHRQQQQRGIHSTGTSSHYNHNGSEVRQASVYPPTYSIETAQQQRQDDCVWTTADLQGSDFVSSVATNASSLFRSEAGSDFDNRPHISGGPPSTSTAGGSSLDYTTQHNLPRQPHHQHRTSGNSTAKSRKLTGAIIDSSRLSPNTPQPPQAGIATTTYGSSIMLPSPSEVTIGAVKASSPYSAEPQFSSATICTRDQQHQANAATTPILATTAAPVTTTPSSYLTYPPLNSLLPPLGTEHVNNDARSSSTVMSGINGAPPLTTASNDTTTTTTTTASSTISSITHNPAPTSPIQNAANCFDSLPRAPPTLMESTTKSCSQLVTTTNGRHRNICGHNDNEDDNADVATRAMSPPASEEPTNLPDTNEISYATADMVAYDTRAAVATAAVTAHHQFSEIAKEYATTWWGLPFTSSLLNSPSSTSNSATTTTTTTAPLHDNKMFASFELAASSHFDSKTSEKQAYQSCRPLEHPTTADDGRTTGGLGALFPEFQLLQGIKYQQQQASSVS